MSKNIFKKSIKDWKSNATLGKIDTDFYLYSKRTLISVEEHAFEISKRSVQDSAENCLETFPTVASWTALHRLPTNAFVFTFCSHSVLINFLLSGDIRKTMLNTDWIRAFLIAVYLNDFNCCTLKLQIKMLAIRPAT